MRIEDSIKALSQLKQNGYNVGSLNWKAPRISVVSPTYSLASSSIVRTANPYCRCRNLRIFLSSNTAKSPPTDTVKEITVKKEPTGEWFASFTVGDKETPKKPTNPDRCIGIDVGILKYAHDTDGTAVESLDLSDDRERLERHSVTFRGRNAVPRIGRDNDKSWPSATPISSESVVTSFTNSRTTTPPNTTS